MGDGTKGLEPQNRPITDEERSLIQWLLRHGKPGSEQFLSQVDSLSVAWKCSCGCPTVHFELRPQPVAREPERILADFLGTVAREDVGVILFKRGDRLSSLDVYSQAGSDKPFGLPPIETLCSYEQLGERQENQPPVKG